MIRALIFAGGTGSRMERADIPKQFLKVQGKPILIHTIEKFENSDRIDEIIVVCIENWMEYLSSQLREYNISKVTKIVLGGSTGQESIFNGLKYMQDNLKIDKDDIVLIHDGVRPMIDRELIDRNIDSVQKYGNCITISDSIETVGTINKENYISKFIDRDTVKIAKAPQSFYLLDIIKYHYKAKKEGLLNFIDCASLMSFYDNRLYTVLGNKENLKITTMLDYYTLKIILDNREEVYSD